MWRGEGDEGEGCGWGRGGELIGGGHGRGCDWKGGGFEGERGEGSGIKTGEMRLKEEDERFGLRSNGWSVAISKCSAVARVRREAEVAGGPSGMHGWLDFGHFCCVACLSLWAMQTSFHVSLRQIDNFKSVCWALIDLSAAGL